VLLQALDLAAAAALDRHAELSSSTLQAASGPGPFWSPDGAAV
jgi:hypothetical protein